MRDVDRTEEGFQPFGDGTRPREYSVCSRGLDLWKYRSNVGLTAALRGRKSGIITPDVDVWQSTSLHPVYSLSLSLSLSSFFLRFVLSEFLRIRQRRSRLSRLPDTGRFNVIIRRACRRVRERRARTTRFWHVIKPDGVARTRPSEQMSGRSLGNVYAGWILYSRDIRRTRAARRPLCRASDSTFKQTPRK